jgi:hypothetical protein
MTPEIRRAALRAAAKTALVAALGCGGDPKPAPQNAQPKDPTTQTPVVEYSEGPSTADLVDKARKAAASDLATLVLALEELDKKVGGAVDEVVSAQNDADRAAAKAKLEKLRKEKADVEQQVATAKVAVARAEKMASAGACIAYLDTLAKAKNGELPAGDPLKDKSGVYGAFANVKDREAARTQSCCAQEMTAFGSSAKHRWECCSALPGLPNGAEQSACIPWGPPSPPEMA